MKHIALQETHSMRERSPPSPSSAQRTPRAIFNLGGNVIGRGGTAEWSSCGSMRKKLKLCSWISLITLSGSQMLRFGLNENGGEETLHEAQFQGRPVSRALHSQENEFALRSEGRRIQGGMSATHFRRELDRETKQESRPDDMYLGRRGDAIGSRGIPSRKCFQTDRLWEEIANHNGFLRQPSSESRASSVGSTLPTSGGIRRISHVRIQLCYSGRPAFGQRYRQDSKHYEGYVFL
uniref:Uncharacterized protein n=1 Tax=Compsopogon caeruleus TaxID=31354 RepID=A0A7S1XHF5_9RHOD|mmetsp:Transcript_9638/g.19686  ORF Transcript_9638/g.19686 Transcript_9638/m.19686 type:complete len:236 (+) Transcript_9638:493-1200(+)